MNAEAYRDYLLSIIPTAKSASGGKEINCRCFYCPDGRSPSSKHFYISIPQKEDEPSIYYCHKCHSSGIVTHQKLIEWNIFNEQVAIDITEQNKRASNNKINRKYFDRTVYKLNYYYTTINDNSEIKLKYIQNRLGYPFTYKELERMKIVLSLNDLLKENHINQLTRNSNIIDQLDKNFLGFISIDNAFLNMRRLCDEGLVYDSIDKRYINYRIFNKFDTSERFYTIPTEIDISKPERIKIHIAEGPFDITSIYVNLRNKEPGIYTCIAGSNYIGIVSYFIQTFKLPYTEFHIYPDNDRFGSNDKMNQIAQFLTPFNSPLYIHRNQYPNQKDFGVAKNLIQESIEKIL